MARRRKVATTQIRSKTRNTRRGSKTKARANYYEIPPRKKRRRRLRRKRKS